MNLPEFNKQISSSQTVNSFFFFCTISKQNNQSFSFLQVVSLMDDQLSFYNAYLQYSNINVRNAQRILNGARDHRGMILSACDKGYFMY
jgi:hypothetical protein